MIIVLDEAFIQGVTGGRSMKRCDHRAEPCSAPDTRACPATPLQPLVTLHGTDRSIWFQAGSLYQIGVRNAKPSEIA
jgi:hypothetical protein